MDNLNKTQKIIIAVISTCMLLVIGYYVMQKTETHSTYDTKFALENNTEEIEKDDTVGLNEKKTIIIHIAGEVKQPGIVYVEEGSRISDVIEKAGGTKGEADLSKVNLAYAVQDGQKIYIPNINDNEETEINTITEENGEDIIIGANETETNLININKASQTELETLNGIGPSTALKIIEYRKQNGNFKKIEDIMDIPGIGEAKFESIKRNITI